MGAWAYTNQWVQEEQWTPARHFIPWDSTPDLAQATWKWPKCSLSSVAAYELNGLRNWAAFSFDGCYEEGGKPVTAAELGLDQIR